MADERTRALLERGAGALPPTPPHAAIARRAEVLRRRRRVAVHAGATALVVAVVASVLGLAASVQRQPWVAYGDADSAAGGHQAPVAGGCVEPVHQPGYLPWLGADADVPPPDSVSRTASGTTLRWSDGVAAAPTVTLARRHGTVSADDGPYVPGGGRMSLLRGGHARVVWNLGGTRCNMLELVLTVPPRTMDGERLQRAVMATALSLATPDGRPLELADPAVCPPPPVLPTYLPWLPDGDAVPSPRVGYVAEESDLYDVTWDAAGRLRGSETYVGMMRITDSEGLRGEPTGHEILGSEGVLETEPNGVGGAHIAWDVGGASCNVITLFFAAESGMTGAEIEQEVRRIADSLAPRPPEVGVLSDGGA